MNHPVHPEAVADLQELLALCSLKFDRLASQEMDAPGFVSCCEEFSSLVHKALNLGTVPPDVSNAIERTRDGWKEPGVFRLNLNFRFGMIESLVGYCRWKRLRTDDDDECSPFVWMLTAGTIAETSLGGLFEPVCESGEGPDFDEDTEDLRAWPEVCRRYALAARLLGRCLVGSPSRGLDPLFLARAGKLLESQDSARADAIDMKNDAAKSCDGLLENVPDENRGDAGKDAPEDRHREGLAYFEAHIEKEISQVYFLYLVGVHGMKTGDAVSRLTSRFPREKYKPSKGDPKPWNPYTGSRFMDLCRKNGISIATGKTWSVNGYVLPAILKIAESEKWELPESRKIPT